MKIIKIFFLLFLIIRVNNLIGLQLVKEVILEKRSDVDYQKLVDNFNKGYRIVSESDSTYFYILLPTKFLLNKNKTQNTINLKAHNFRNELSVFSKTGKFIKTIGEQGSYARDGYSNLNNIKIINNEVQLTSNRTVVYDKNTLTFKYNIDSSSFENYNFRLQINAVYKNKCFGEQPYQFNIKHYDDGFVAYLANDPEYKGVKIISDVKNFLNVKEYEKMIFANYELHQKIEKNDSPQIRSFIKVVQTNGVFISTKFEIMDDGSYYAINGFATELFFYNKFDILKQRISLNQILDLRKREIKSFVSGKKHLAKNHYFSYLDNFFMDKKNDIIFLSFQTSKIIQDEINSKRMLFAYSIKDNAIILNLAPIDFYPVTYNEKSNLLVGIKVLGDKVKFQFYRIKI